MASVSWSRDLRLPRTSCNQMWSCSTANHSFLVVHLPSLLQPYSRVFTTTPMAAHNFANGTRENTIRWGLSKFQHTIIIRPNVCSAVLRMCPSQEWCYSPQWGYFSTSPCSSLFGGPLQTDSECKLTSDVGRTKLSGTAIERSTSLKKKSNWYV